MHILVTGVNTTQARTVRKTKKWLVTSVYAVESAIAASGHTFEKRQIEPTDTLEEFDLVIVYLAPIGGWTSSFFLGAMAGIDIARKAGKLVLGADDWQIARAAPSFAGFVRPDCIEKNWPKPLWYKPLEFRQHRENQVLAGIEWITKSTWDVPFIAPTFGGFGDLRDLCIPCTGKQFAFDPSTFFSNLYGTTPSIERSKTWVYHSLTNRTKWLDTAGPFSWPVRCFGNKASGHERVSEEFLINEVCAKSWGILSPPTGLKTGLWWRSRYQFAAEAGAILAGDPRETSFCGDEYSMSVQDIESLPEHHLSALAEYQRQRYFTIRWSREQLFDRFAQFFKEVKS